MVQALPGPSRSLRPIHYVLCAGLFGVLLWAYWTYFVRIAGHWWKDPQYTHGPLVPLFCLFLLFWRKDLLRDAPPRSEWWGLWVLLAGVALRLVGAFYFLDFAEGLSLLVCVAGLGVLLGGWPALRWSWPAIVFLVFMLPLPYSIETALAYPLRRIASESSAYVVVALGIPAMVSGTDIYINDRPQALQVAAACSGMGMLLVFFALSTAIVFVIDRPRLDKLIILLSAVPIAIVSNVVRISVTAVFYQLGLEQAAFQFFHNWAGYAMILIGLGLLWVELWFFDHLFIRTVSRRPLGLEVRDKAGREPARLPRAKADPNDGKRQPPEPIGLHGKAGKRTGGPSRS